MTCCARRLGFRRTVSLGLACVSIALLAGGSTLALRAAEADLPVATATFSGGTAQLRVVSAAQEPEGRRNFNAKLEFQLEISPADAVRPGSKLPADLYVDNDATPFLNATVTAGRNLAKNAHVWAVDGAVGRITIGEIDVGEARPRLQGVEVEVLLTKVTDWEMLAFQAGPGRSDFFQCGPWELRSTGDDKQFRVDLWSYPQFKQQHDDYRRRMPLNFLGYPYAIQQLKVTDANGRTPTSIASSTPSAGAMSNTYTGFRAANGADAAATDAIAYPVSLTLRMPKRFVKERVKFRFDAIPLPQPPAPAAPAKKR